jgi:hypothetical protein
MESARTYELLPAPTGRDHQGRAVTYTMNHRPEGGDVGAVAGAQIVAINDQQPVLRPIPQALRQARLSHLHTPLGPTAVDRGSLSDLAWHAVRNSRILSLHGTLQHSQLRHRPASDDTRRIFPIAISREQLAIMHDEVADLAAAHHTTSDVPGARDVRDVEGDWRLRGSRWREASTRVTTATVL